MEGADVRCLMTIQAYRFGGVLWLYFNFDIDKIADNAITKTDKTTEIIVVTDTATGQVSFYDKLTLNNNPIWPKLLL